MSRLPDETTILRFGKTPSQRQMLEAHGLGQQILATVNAKLIDRGLMLKMGTVVDAKLIAAPCSTKNEKSERDPEMHQTKKGNQ
jgi:IS5 family transposase